MKILNQRQITQKVKRLAIEIVEHNFGEPEIILAGINNNGMVFAEMLLQELTEISNIPNIPTITVTRIQLNPANPLKSEVRLEMPSEQAHNKVIILVDDVANTGRTIFYAIKPLLDILPKKVEVAVLVDRSHKAFPIRVDYYGVSLATTLKNDIDVQIREVAEKSVFLN